MEYLLGIIVSLTVEGFKHTMKWSKYGTYVMLLVLCVGLGFLYQWALVQVWWQTALQALVVAAAFHNLVIRQLQEK